MKPRITCRALLSALAVIVFSVGTAVGADGDEKAVREAGAQFYSALNVMFTEDLEPMKKVWSHAEDVTYMGPGGGLRVGWSEVLKDWESQEAMKLEEKLRPWICEFWSVAISQSLKITRRARTNVGTESH